MGWSWFGIAGRDYRGKPLGRQIFFPAGPNHAQRRPHSLKASVTTSPSRIAGLSTPISQRTVAAVS